MADVTRNEIIDEVLEKLKPIKKDASERGKKFFENLAVITSLAVIYLSILLFEYNTGYCKAFNLPSECMAIDMKMLIPFAAQIGMNIVGILFYLSSLKTDKALGKYHFSITRLCWGEIVLITFVSKNQLINVIGYWGSLLITYSIPLLLELMFYLRQKPRKNKVVAEKDHDDVLELTLRDAIFHDYYIKRGLVFLVLPLAFASSIGKLAACSNHYYRTIVFEDTQYAVIIEYSDEVLVQSAEIENDTLTIDTNEYRYLSKDGLVFSYKEYDDVIIGYQADENKSQLTTTTSDTPTESSVPIEESKIEPTELITIPIEESEEESQ